MPDEVAEYRSCDVCGRTILRGERVRDYVTSNGEQVSVCSLCLTRAEAAGWLPAELAGDHLGAGSPRSRPGEALRARLGRVADRAREAASSAREAATARRERPAEEPEPEPSAKASGPPKDEGEGAKRQRPAPKAKREPKRAPAKRDAAKPRAAGRGGAKPRAAPAKRRAPRTPELVKRAAVERFNASAEARKVAGLIRSLGEPSVTVQPSGGKATVTIAWELSWYQWEVEAGDPGEVREVAKGKEVSELGEEAQGWNAAAGPDGKLALNG